MATALLAAGTGLMAYGSIREGQLANAQGEAQNKIAQYNAQMLDRESASRMDAAHLEEERVSRQSKIFMASQRAQFAKSGVSLESGSPLEVQADTAYQFAMDRNLTLRQGVLDAQKLKNQANIQRVEGKWAKQVGKQQRTNSYLKAGATILGGAYGISRAGTGGSSVKQFGGSSSQWQQAQSSGLDWVNR